MTDPVRIDPAATASVPGTQLGLIASPTPLVAAADLRTAAPPVKRPDPWTRTYQRLVFATDVSMLCVAAALAFGLRFGFTDEHLRGVSYLAIAGAAIPLWILGLAANRAYEQRFLGVGAEEHKRVADATIKLVALVAFTAYLSRIELSRLFFGLFVAFGAALLLISRYADRQWLHRQQAKGRYASRLLLVGTAEQVAELAAQVRRASYTGYRVVGACVPAPAFDAINDPDVPILGGFSTVAQVAEANAIESVAVAASGSMSSSQLRRLAWTLEGSGVDLLVSPALTDVAGPRIHIRPIAGLPLLHIEQPELSGTRRIVKNVFDRIAASGTLIVLALPLLCVGFAVKLSGPGPVLFSQTRVGKGGREFTIYKFRSMAIDAEGQLDDLLDLNESDGLLFKMREDPRVTPVGRFLRRFSIDELPQLWNVVRGDMSLVGPRPPLPSEVADYGTDVRRRLLVRPGVTGLWQVSGRADIPWDDGIRLDLYYTENWSFALDLMIVWKTFAAVIRGRGAY
jgi:exopolysaccharide biosynthesis polyprenyl glycosylphosphotransferase